MIVTELPTINWKPVPFPSHNKKNHLTDTIDWEFGERVYRFVPHVYQTNQGEWEGYTLLEYDNPEYDFEVDAPFKSRDWSQTTRGTFAEALEGAAEGLRNWIARIPEYYANGYSTAVAARRLQEGDAQEE